VPLEGLGQFKNPMTSSGIATACPSHEGIIVEIKKETREESNTKRKRIKEEREKLKIKTGGRGLEQGKRNASKPA
jgi:hypothetical protein